MQIYPPNHTVSKFQFVLRIMPKTEKGGAYPKKAPGVLHLVPCQNRNHLTPNAI